MTTCLRSVLALAVLLPLASCDKPAPPAANVTQADPDLEKAQAELAAARDALQRQALEIETKTALMDKQLADMAQMLKEQENAELRSSLDALQKQNDDLRSQADTARRQSNAIAQKIAPLPPVSVTPAVTATPDYSLFYDQLASQGRWFDVSGYGYCWRPTITMPRWRPYLDGCWMWSSLGWTWQSNEPFGWIVYHYGRWVNLSRYGWVWVPGSEWAPAWVAWRQSRDYVGWAPLPPDRGPCSGVYRDCDSHYNLGPTSYTFITTNHFVQPSYTTVCAPVTYNTSIFQSSVNVTQIVRCDDRKRPNVFMHHGGPPRAQMEQACARPVQQVQVQTTSADQIPRSRPGHHRGERPSQPVIVDLPAARTGTPPVRPQIAEHIDKPKRVDAFEGVPQRVAQEIRETIAEEKASAVVQQQPVVVEAPSRGNDRPNRRPAPVVTPVPSETVRPTIAIEDKPAATTIPAVAADEAPRTRPAWTRPERPQPADPAVVSAPEPEKPAPAPVVMPAQPSQPAPLIAAETAPAVTDPIPPVAAETTPPQPPAAEKMTVETALAEAQRQQEAQQRAAAEKMTAEQQAATAEAEKARMQAAAEQNQREQAQAAIMQQKEQAAQQRATAEKMAAEQAQTAEAERTRQQAEAVAMQQKQQEEQAAQQRATPEKMTAEQAQAAAEAERARQLAEAAAMQQRQQEEQAAQQRAAAEKMAAEQAQAVVAEAERARQQAEAAAMQRQQEEAARRAQEMAQREAEEQARRQAEVEMRRAQEEAARRAAEEQIRLGQEMAQRRAEEEARRQAETEMRRAQEMAQRQAEEAARRAQEEAQRAAAEAAARAAAEAARNQPQPQNPGS
jgi:hypothetical protein